MYNVYLLLSLLLVIIFFVLFLFESMRELISKNICGILNVAKEGKISFDLLPKSSIYLLYIF